MKSIHFNSVIERKPKKCIFLCISEDITPSQIDALPPFSNSIYILLMVKYYINVNKIRSLKIKLLSEQYSVHLWVLSGG